MCISTKMKYSNSKGLSGASGSPLLDRQGQVVGVFHMSAEEWIDSITVIKSRHLREFVRGDIGAKCSSFRSVKECIEEEREKIVELAEAGNPQAQYDLYQWYFTGKEEMKVEENPELALKWLERAAEGGYIPAQYDLFQVCILVVMKKMGLQKILSWL